MKNNGCRNEDKTLWLGSSGGGIGPIHLENKLKATILRMYGSGSCGGWAVAVGGGKERTCSPKEAPVPRDDIQTRAARQ